MRKINSIVYLFIIVCIIFASGCMGDQSSNNTNASSDIKVGTWKTAQTITPYLYSNFTKDSIEVLPFTNPGDQKAALLANQLNLTGTTIALAITAASNGEPVVVVSTLSNKCSAIVVGNTSDIKTSMDLKGKTIGYVPGTMHHVLLLETLKKANLDPQQDVTLKRVDFFDMGQALSQGQIDAFCSGEPYPTLAVSQGYGRILIYPYYNDSIGTINSGMMTTQDQIINNRATVQRLVTAHVEATQYLQNHPEEWIALSSKFGNDPEILRLASNNIDLAWDIDENYIKQAENLALRMRDLGLITQIPDMNKLFDRSFVMQAKKDLNNTSSSQ